jgi:hypothetical protein
MTRFEGENERKWEVNPEQFHSGNIEKPRETTSNFNACRSKPRKNEENREQNHPILNL